MANLNYFITHYLEDAVIDGNFAFSKNGVNIVFPGRFASDRYSASEHTALAAWNAGRWSGASFEAVSWARYYSQQDDGYVNVWSYSPNDSLLISGCLYKYAGNLMWYYINGNFAFNKFVEKGNETSQSASNQLASSQFYFYLGLWVKSVAISLNFQGGTSDQGSAEYYFDDTITLSDPVRTGYTFAGWNTAADGSGTAVADGDYISDIIGEATNGNLTLYAQWNQPTLTYDANGGSPTPSPQSYVGTITLAAAPTKVHRQFLGWDIGGTIYGAGDTYELTANVTATAVWSKIVIENTTPNAGTIALYDTASATTVATAENGWIEYDGVEGRTYKIVPTAAAYLYEGAEETFTLGDEEISLTYAFTEKAVYTIGFGSFTGTAEVLSPASPDKTVSGTDYYAAGREVRIRLTPVAGYKATLVQWVVNGASDGSPVSVGDDGTVTIANLTGNTVGLVATESLQYTVTAAAHSASTGKINASASESSVTYDTAVEFTATPNTGYAFEGWYDANGTKVSSANPYTVNATGDIALYAKAKVTVTMGMWNPDGATLETCGITVNGSAYTDAFEVTLGESFDYALTLGVREESSNWELDGWYKSQSSQAPLPYAQTGTIAPTAAITMLAKVVANAAKTLNVIIVNMGTSANARVSKDDLPSAIRNTAITFTTNVVPSLVAERIPLGGPGGEEMQVTITPFSKSVNGTQYIKIDAIDAITFDGETDTKNFYGLVKTFDATYDGNLLPPDEDVISRSTETIVLLTGSEVTLYAFYGEARDVTTTVAFASGHAGRGEIGIAGETGTSKEATQGTTLTLTATAHNGYAFKGWFANASGNGSALYTGETVVVPVTSERTLYAVFGESDKAIFEWEGSGTNKEFTWRSKTYSATKPFNPSVARVDSEGYPLKELAVEMFSSPDKSATQSVKLTDVENQTMRRLPARRPERYLQVEVKNNSAVNAVIVSTSAEEARA